MIFRKVRKNVKAISPIIATLLLIAIAVVASLVVYAWVMGYIGAETTNAGNSVLIQSVTPSTTNPDSVYQVYLQNTGNTPVNVNSFVFVNGQEEPATLSSANPLPGGSTVTITLTTAATVPAGVQYTVKVTTTGGTYSQETLQAP